MHSFLKTRRRNKPEIEFKLIRFQYQIQSFVVERTAKFLSWSISEMIFDCYVLSPLVILFK
jgi:hypothetical protein